MRQGLGAAGLDRRDLRGEGGESEIAIALTGS
jgi:hypothetical protein